MKILIFDVETTPILGYTWKTWKTDVISIKQDWQMICFAYKWYGQKKRPTFVRPDLEDPWKDRDMVKQLWLLFNEADVIIGHNLDRFDIKKTNAMFLRHNLTPPAPYKTIDTLKVARKNFANSSNRLDSLGELLNIGRKAPTHGYMALFNGTMEENTTKAWNIMRKYNIQDVILTEQLYEKLLPWITNHPIDLDNPEGCTNCGSTHIIARGYRETRSFRYQRFQCGDCHSWMRGRKHVNKDKPLYV